MHKSGVAFGNTSVNYCVNCHENDAAEHEKYTLARAETQGLHSELGGGGLSAWNCASVLKGSCGK